MVLARLGRALLSSMGLDGSEESSGVPSDHPGRAP